MKFICALICLLFIGEVTSLKCNQCTKLNFKTPLLNNILPGLGGCTEVECQPDENCFGMKAKVNARAFGNDIEGSVEFQSCVNGKKGFVGDANILLAIPQLPLPVCQKADVEYLNYFLKIVSFVEGISDVKVDGLACICGTDFCDAVCSNGFPIGNRCFAYYLIGVAGGGVVALFLLCFLCCCCCCKCCCFKKTRIIPSVAANPLLVVSIRQNGVDGPNASLPAYEHFSNRDDVPLLKP